MEEIVSIDVVAAHEHRQARVVTTSFEDFAAAAAPRLMRTAYLLTGNRADAQDLVQEALARVFVAWRRVREEPYGYTHRVLVNLNHNRWRWLHRHPTTHADDTPETADVTDAFGEVAQRDSVVRALQQLPHRQRAVIVLRYYEDRSEAETAALLGISQGTVKSQSAKAFARLRALLGDERRDRPGESTAGGRP